MVVATPVVGKVRRFLVVKEMRRTGATLATSSNGTSGCSVDWRSWLCSLNTVPSSKKQTQRENHPTANS